MKTLSNQIAKSFAKKLLAATALSIVVLGAPITSKAESNAELLARINKLEENLNLLKRQLEIKEEVEKTKAEKSANVEFNKKGLNITGADKKYSLKIGGYGQVDARKYFDDKNNNTDQFVVRSARPSLEIGLPSDITAKIVTDFGNGNPRLVDGFASWKANDYFILSGGKLKNPLGLERQGKETETLFVERGLPTNLVPFRDLGLLASGVIIKDVLDYQLAFTNGAVDLEDPNGDASGGKDISGRVLVKPFGATSIYPLQGLALGFAASAGQRDGNATNTELAANYKTTAQNKFFTYNAGTFADGKNIRLNPQALYYYGPLGIVAEYVSSSNEVTNGVTKTELKNTAWTALVTYLLTDDEASFDGVKPKSEFDLSNGTWGAFEVAGRFSRLDIDDKTFPLYASLTNSATAVTEKVLGLNWYLNSNVKFNINYSINNFDGGAATGDKLDEKALLTRLQFKF